jgi:hypothetical protein
VLLDSLGSTPGATKSPSGGGGGADMLDNGLSSRCYLHASNDRVVLMARKYRVVPCIINGQLYTIKTTSQDKVHIMSKNNRHGTNRTQKRGRCRTTTTRGNLITCLYIRYQGPHALYSYGSSLIRRAGVNSILLRRCRCCLGFVPFR